MSSIPVITCTVHVDVRVDLHVDVDVHAVDVHAVDGCTAGDTFEEEKKVGPLLPSPTFSPPTLENTNIWKGRDWFTAEMVPPTHFPPVFFSSVYQKTGVQMLQTMYLNVKVTFNLVDSSLISAVVIVSFIPALVINTYHYFGVHLHTSSKAEGCLVKGLKERCR